MKRTNISPERKAIYYIGITLIVIGGITFFSVFISGALHFGDFSNFKERAQSEMLRSMVGMALIFIGGILSAIGRAGAAGSGIILDPQKARTDLEPWSRMAGGLVKDAIDEADISLKTPKRDDKLPFDEQLRRLHKLHQDGIISKEEYDLKKSKILNE